MFLRFIHLASDPKLNASQPSLKLQPALQSATALSKPKFFTLDRIAPRPGLHLSPFLPVHPSTKKIQKNPYHVNFVRKDFYWTTPN